jgi:hypothetical protein
MSGQTAEYARFGTRPVLAAGVAASAVTEDCAGSMLVDAGNGDRDVRRRAGAERGEGDELVLSRGRRREEETGGEGVEARKGEVVDDRERDPDEDTPSNELPFVGDGL